MSLENRTNAGSRKADNHEYLSKPATSAAIDRVRHILKRTPGSQPFKHEWAAHKQEEIDLEEKKYTRLTGSRKQFLIAVGSVFSMANW